MEKDFRISVAASLVIFGLGTCLEIHNTTAVRGKRLQDSVAANVFNTWDVNLPGNASQLQWKSLQLSVTAVSVVTLNWAMELPENIFMFK